MPSRNLEYAAIVEQFDAEAAAECESMVDPDTTRIRKLRRCLMCFASFLSEWSGERICQKCRARAAWRSGE